MSPFDIVTGSVFAISAGVGLVRGATREITTAAAFILAALIAVFGLRFTGPIARQAIHTVWLADTAAILFLFAIAYIGLRTIGGAMIRGVRQTSLSGPDRVLGGAIGLARGLLVVGALALMIGAATPHAGPPGWVAGARLLPLADATGAAMRGFAPQGLRMARAVAPVLEQAVTQDGRAPQDGAAPSTQAPASAGPAEVPGAVERKSLNVVVEKSGEPRSRR